MTLIQPGRRSVSQKSRPETEDEPLSQVATHLLEECRMVLPGIQALFGFQLIAVFNDAFSTRLSAGEQFLHLAAIGLVAVAIALVMAPAAYHRQAEPETISRTFIVVSGNLLKWSMPPLAAAICLDLYLIARLILQSRLVSLLLSLALLIVFGALWVVLPRLGRFHPRALRPPH